MNFLNSSFLPMIAGGGNDKKNNVVPKDINFYDYEGTIVDAWTLDELASATALPINPSHKGLVSQGWNWTLADLKTTNRPMNIGQMYITDDGKTRLYITIADEGRMVVPLYFFQTLFQGVSINWGDGSVEEKLNDAGYVSIFHTYDSIGDYIITLDVSDECILGLGQNSDIYCVMGSTDYSGRVYCNMLKKVEIGAGVTNIGIKDLQYCSSLTSVTIPNSVKSIGKNAFQSCYSLTNITIPDKMVSIGTYAFSDCCSLSNVQFSNSLSNIGTNAFSYCTSLASITISNNVSSISDNVFQSCNSVSSVIIPNNISIIRTYAFSGCYSLKSIVTPSGITYIEDYAFNKCYSLSTFVFAKGITNIGNSSFGYCYSLVSITIPKTVKSIGAGAFSGCYGMKNYHVLATTPPTLSSTNVFLNIPSDCIIYVPVGTLATYKAATNWSTYSKYMKEEGT